MPYKGVQNICYKYTECFTIVETNNFSVGFIIFLFSDYCWEIVNILIYLTKYNKIMSWMIEQKIFCVKTYNMKQSLSKLFKQDTKGSSISMDFQVGVRSSSWSRTLKLMAVLKIIRLQVPPHSD